MSFSSVKTVSSSRCSAPQYAVVPINQSLVCMEELQRRMYVQNAEHEREVARLITQRREESMDVVVLRRHYENDRRACQEMIDRVRRDLWSDFMVCLAQQRGCATEAEYQRREQWLIQDFEAQMQEVQADLTRDFEEQARGIQAAFLQEYDEEMQKKDEIHAEALQKKDEIHAEALLEKDRELASLRQALLEKDRESASLKHALAEKDRAICERQGELAGARKELASLREANAKLAGAKKEKEELSRCQAQLASAKSELEGLKASREKDLKEAKAALEEDFDQRIYAFRREQEEQLRKCREESRNSVQEVKKAVKAQQKAEEKVRETEKGLAACQDKLKTTESYLRKSDKAAMVIAEKHHDFLQRHEGLAGEAQKLMNKVKELQATITEKDALISILRARESESCAVIFHEYSGSAAGGVYRG